MKKKIRKLFVLVRADLSKSQQGVQAAHAVAELCIHGNKRAWSNGTIVILKVKDLEMLKHWQERLSIGHGRFSDVTCFFEPDIQNQMTALAFVDYDFDGQNLLPLM